MNDKISIVIPIYNTVKYLDRCLKSVCMQTYENLEIICVDDGSTDGSQNIVDEYARKDNRIRVVHQKNAGESNARNIGLQMCTGDFIGFMDCDDWIESEMYEILINKMRQYDVDMVASCYYIDTDNVSKVAENQLPVTKEVFGRHELFQYVYRRDLYRGFSSYIWCKIYRRELIFCSEEKIEFDESLTIGGDILFFLKLASRVKKALYIEIPLYHYYQRNDSAMHSHQNVKPWIGSIKAYQKSIAYLREKHIEEEIIPWLERFLGYRASIVAEYAYEQRDIEVLNYSLSVMREIYESYRNLNQEYPDRMERYNNILKYRI